MPFHQAPHHTVGSRRVARGQCNPAERETIAGEPRYQISLPEPCGIECAGDDPAQETGSVTANLQTIFLCIPHLWSTETGSLHTRLVENPIVSKQDSFVSILWSMCYGKSSTPFILHLNLEKTNYMYSSPLYVNHTCDVSLFTNHCVVCIIRAVLCILRHELCILRFVVCMLRPCVLHPEQGLF